MTATDSTWAAFNAQESRLVAQAQGARMDADYWKAAAQQWQDKAQALESVKAQLVDRSEELLRQTISLRDQVKHLQAANLRLRSEVDRLNTPELASNQEARAWRWVCGDQAQGIVLCEVDGNEFVPVLTSRSALEIVADEMRRVSYSPLWTTQGVLNDMARIDRNNAAGA